MKKKQIDFADFMTDAEFAKFEKAVKATRVSDIIAEVNNSNPTNGGESK